VLGRRNPTANTNGDVIKPTSEEFQEQKNTLM
jgi:hypothetical protein